MGISCPMVWYYAHKLGCQKKKRSSSILTAEQRQWVIDNYANTCTAEMAEKLGITVSQLYTQSKTLGLKKSHEFLSQRSSKAIHQVWEDERRRFHMGLPQKTLYFVDRKSERTYARRKRLLRHKYFLDKEYNRAYWDEKTDRRPILEQRYANQFTFAEWTPEIAAQYDN